jgi:hypothetical protein
MDPNGVVDPPWNNGFVFWMNVASLSYVGSKRIDISFGGEIIDMFISSKLVEV